MEALRDITQHLLRFSPDALIVVDDRGTIRFANETIRDLLGYEPDRLLGQSVDMLIPARLRGRHGQLTAGYMRAPTNREMGARVADLFAMRSDGSEFAAGIRLAPFRVGDRLFVAAAIRDVSERRRVNEELVIAREEADRANRAKSRFLATASHDLRQPMQTIRLLNASLLKTVPDPSTREVLEQQEVAIESMTRLLNALLDISRLESGAIEPVKSDVRLEEIFEELRSELSSVARARGIALDIEPCPFVLFTDRTLFSQLLQNLLGNALKYTDQGSVSVDHQIDAEAFSINIRDTGIGIPADKLERIFDEYYQVDTHGTKRMGVGLGLAIVKEVARLLGYSVRITSKVGEGTHVAVRVPRQCVRDDLKAAPVGGLDRQAIATNVQPRLFLVEDNDGVRLATALFLKLEGFETFSAGSVVEAEALFGSMKRGDVLIADYHLDPQNTGLDMLVRLRERVGYDVPAVILSGDLPSMLRSIKTEIPACQFLGKPVDTAALLGAIAQFSR